MPWINKKNAIKKRDALFWTAKATGKPTDRAKYNQKRNHVVRMLRDEKQLFFDQRLNNVDAETFRKTIFDYLIKITLHKLQHYRI